jgi:hypothetical protein
MKTAVERLAVAQKGGLVEVSPGRWVPVTVACVPEIVLARMEAVGRDGAYRCVPLTEQWRKLDQPTVNALGLNGQWHTLTRLAAAGFIEIVHVSPGVSLLNLASWWGHLKRVAEDPWFWEAPRRRSAYLAVCREIGTRSQRKRLKRRPAGPLANSER